MRITLKWRITAILMLVGLIPAMTVGAFAYFANDDYKNKQILIVQKTAEYINFRAKVALQTDMATAVAVVAGTTPMPASARNLIQDIVSQELSNSRINSATVYIVNGEGNMLVGRQASGRFENAANNRIDFRYTEIVKAAVDHEANKNVDSREIASSDDSSSKTDLVAYAARHLEVVPAEGSGHQYLVTLVIVPQDVVFEAIKKNQRYTIGILAAVVVLTSVIGYLIALWFIRPLL
jgi:hypothetical protein